MIPKLEYQIPMTMGRLIGCLLFLLSANAVSGAETYPLVSFGPPGPHQVTKVSDSLYLFSQGGARNIFIVTDEGVIVTDPMNAVAAKALRAEIAKITDAPVKYVIYSHEHWDHILGGKIFEDEGATFVSQFNCLEHFYREPHQDLIFPDITYERNHTIVLGGQQIELLYFGRNHGQCMTVMHIPQERMIFIVDLVTKGRVSGAGGTMRDFYPRDWIRTLREIEALDFDQMIASHGPAISDRSTVAERRRYLEALMLAVRNELEAGTPYRQILGRIELPEFSYLQGYDLYLRANAERILDYYVAGH